MKIVKNKPTLFIFLLVLILFLSNTGMALPDPVSTDSLHFTLSKEIVFIPGTYEDDTIAVNKFSLYFDQDYIDNNDLGDSSVTEIYITFKYSADSLNIIEYNPCCYWPGKIELSDSMVSNDTVTIQLRLYDGSVSPPISDTAFAEIEFLPMCQSSKDILDLEFCGNPIDNQLTMGTNIYRPLDFNDGEVKFQDYVEIFTISHDTLQGALGTLIDVPVYWNSTHRTKWIIQYLTFDTCKLELDSIIYSDPTPWWRIEDDLRKDTIEIEFLNINGYDTAYNVRVLYTLRFKAICSCGTCWDGETTNLTFDNTRSYTLPYGCSSLDVNEGYSSGSVTVEEYHADLRYRFVPDSIGPGDTPTITMWLDMKGNFTMGDSTEEAIMATLNMQDYFDDISLGHYYSPDSNIKFSYGQDDSCGHIQATPYQTYEAGIDNYWTAREDYDSLIDLSLDIDTTIYRADPGIYLDFAEINRDDDTTQVEDVNGCVSTNGINDKLTLENKSDTLLIRMGEFSTNQAHLPNNSGWPQNVYIRNNFNVDSFWVKVHVSSDYIKMFTITTYGDVEDSLVNDTCVIFYCGDQIEANDDDYTMIGCIGYGFKPGCQSGTIYEGDVSFSEMYMEDSEGNQPIILTDPKTTKGKCGGLRITSCPLGIGGLYRSHAGLEEENDLLLPTAFKLHVNRPNPFNPRTTIAYEVPVVAHVKIDVYNIMGQGIKTLVDEVMPTGVHEVIWDGTDENGHQVATGVYFYSMEAGNFRDSRKMILMK